MPRMRLAARFLLLIALALQCAGLHAELFFERPGSPARKYGNPADVDAKVLPWGSAATAEEVRVYLSGPITRADVDSASVMATLLKNGKHRLAGNTMWFASTGGDVDAAMDLGRMLRELGIFAAVARNDQCFSACVFAFMGGERRTVAGQLGIHRPFLPYTHDVPGRQLRFRHLERVLRGYVEELDFPASLYEAVMQVPPESLRILAMPEMKAFFLEGISPASEDLADAAAARRLGLNMADYLKVKGRKNGG
jgi:hypothetical protein